MRNTIRYVKHDEVNKVKQYFHEKDHGLLVELYGQELPTWQSYAQEIAKKLNFPIENAYTFDGYLDWITDLSWHDDIRSLRLLYTIIPHYLKVRR
jgi:hypothetical protein